MGIGIFYWLFYLFITALFLVPVGAGLIYLLIGVGQLVIGYKEKNSIKKKAGSITIILSITGIIIVVFIWYKILY